MVYHGRWKIPNVLFMSFGDHASEFPIDPSNRHHHQQQQQQQHLVSPECIRLSRRCHVPQQIQTICLYNYIDIYICVYADTDLKIVFVVLFIFIRHRYIYYMSWGGRKPVTVAK